MYYKQFYLPFVEEKSLNSSEEIILPTETAEYIEFKKYLEYTEKFNELIILEVKDFAIIKDFPDFGKYVLKENFINGYPFVDEENLIAFKIDSSRGTIEGINYLSGYKATICVDNHSLKDIPEVENIYQFKDWLLKNTTMK